MSEKSFLLRISLLLLILVFAFPDVACAENITPAQEQEFTDAKGALEAARKERYRQKNLPLHTSSKHWIS
jgi:uncharacterized membrane protein YgcG